MWKKRVSPKVLKATEKYLTSIGRKREELTEEQWNFMVDYIKKRCLIVPILIFFVLFCTVMTYLYWHQGHKYYTKVIPHQTVKISFDDQRESITLSPEEIRRYLRYVTDCYMMAGMQFELTIFMLIFLFGSVMLTKIMNRKTHRILLSRPTTTRVVV